MNLDNFIADCKSALAESSPSHAVREVVARAVSSPVTLIRAVGEPDHGQIQRLHVSDELTVLNVIWAPRMTLRPHNHEMWANIGVYSGREDNIFWKRLADDASGRIEATRAKSIGPGEIAALGREVIHSVTNPTTKYTGAIHVYGGDFFAIDRSEWDAESLEEQPYDVDRTLELFEQANKALASD